MEVVVVCSLLSILVVFFLFVYVVGIFKEICFSEKDFYIKTLEEENEMLKEFIEWKENQNETV